MKQIICSLAIMVGAVALADKPEWLNDPDWIDIESQITVTPSSTTTGAWTGDAFDSRWRDIVPLVFSFKSTPVTGFLLFFR